MKKIFAIFTLVIGVLLLAGCTPAEESASDKLISAEQIKAQDKLKFFNANLGLDVSFEYPENYSVESIYEPFRKITIQKGQVGKIEIFRYEDVPGGDRPFGFTGEETQEEIDQYVPKEEFILNRKEEFWRWVLDKDVRESENLNDDRFWKTFESHKLWLANEKEMAEKHVYALNVWLFYNANDLETKKELHNIVRTMSTPRKLFIPDPKEFELEDLSDIEGWSYFVSGYPILKVEPKPLCETEYQECKMYTNVYFNLLEGEKVNRIKLNKEGLEEGYLGFIGCLSENKIIWNTSYTEKYGMTKLQVPKNLSSAILKATKENPITIQLDSSRDMWATDALPECYSNFTRIKTVK